jgi:dTDP-4-dehydrorhamnose reductase
MILLTGGSGLLGSALKNLIPCYAPSHDEFDITNPVIPGDKTWDLIVHCAAYTDVARAEIEKSLCYRTNVVGTHMLSKLNIPMLYISTEYVFDGYQGNYSEEDIPNPLNFYALTKLLGEFTLMNKDHRIVRTLFKPRPFEHEAACVDQFTSGDYVDVIAKEVALAIEHYGELPDIINIGTGRKSTFSLANESKQVIPITVSSVGVRLPRDTSLDLTKWQMLKGEWGKK